MRIAVYITVALHAVVVPTSALLSVVVPHHSVATSPLYVRMHLEKHALPWCTGRNGELRMTMSSTNDVETLMEDACPPELTADACPLDLVPARCLAHLDHLAPDNVAEALLASGEVRGTESTTRDEATLDKGCSWVEDAETLTAELRIPGLRGQPAGCLAAHVAATNTQVDGVHAHLAVQATDIQDVDRNDLGTVTVMAFGRVVWGCVLRGAIVPDMTVVEAEDVAHQMPVLRVSVRKQPGSPRWGGFIGAIDTDCLLS
jgi:hypothetical protein